MKIDDYEMLSKNILKDELAKQNITMPKLSDDLKKIGIKETSANLTNKINRGTFTFSFLLQVLNATKINLNIRLEDESVTVENPVSKEELIESYLNLAELTRDIDDDYVLERIGEAAKDLFRKIGLSDALIENMDDLDLELTIFNSDITAEQVSGLYDDLVRKQNVLNKLAEFNKKMD